MSVDEELAIKVQEEEQAKARQKQEQERINFEAALELQRQLSCSSEKDSFTMLRDEVRKNMVCVFEAESKHDTKPKFLQRNEIGEIGLIFEKSIVLLVLVCTASEGLNTAKGFEDKDA
ncbi:hypothetical protein Tco_1237019 [Tanacetum coccineum]